MSDTPHVVVSLRVQNSGIARQGTGKPLVLSHNADAWAERSRTYSNLAGVLTDWAADSPEAIAATQLFSQEPHPKEIGIGRAATAILQKYRIDVAAVALGSTYKLNVAGQNFDDASVTYKTLADQTFVGANAGDLATAVAHGMADGDGPYRVSNAGGALPTGLAVDTNYWIHVLTADTYQFATSKANALAGTAIVLSSDGTGTQTLRRNQNDVIVAQLVQGLNAIADKTFTAVQQAGSGETDYLEVTANADGNWFSISVGAVELLSIAQTHDAGAIGAELAAILLADKSWYWLVTLYNSQDYIQDCAAWVEANGRVYAPETVDTEVITTAYDADTSDDVIATITGFSYKRTEVWYHHIPAQIGGAAKAGLLAPLDPGSWTDCFKTLVGVTASPLNTTHRTNLVNRRGNGYMIEMGRSITFEGMVGNQDFGFLDITVGLDAFVDDLRAAIFGVQVANLKIGYTDPDLLKVKAAGMGSCKRYSSEQRPVFTNDPAPTFTVPKVADIDADTRALRVLPDCTVHGQLTGAAQTILIDITVTP